MTYVSNTLQLKHLTLSRLKLCMRKLTALEPDFLFVSHHWPWLDSDFFVLSMNLLLLSAALLVVTEMVVVDFYVLVLIQCPDKEWNGDIHDNEDWATSSEVPFCRLRVTQFAKSEFAASFLCRRWRSTVRRRRRRRW